jgi:DNA-binding NtrC family response regulator/TolB-like protein
MDTRRGGPYNYRAMDPLRDLLGQSPGIVALRQRVVRALVARDIGLLRLPPVLIRGDTGTGKSLLALTMHRASTRSGGRFVELNCAAIPEHLVESELFGYERGAFTDARQAKRGLLQVADRGTLFLDEVGLLPGQVQGKLLRVLEDPHVRPLGSTQSEPVNVWIIAATNADLEANVRQQRFREDLYHRLAVVTLWLPPLRERREDIDLLADHALTRACEKYGIDAERLTLSPEAREALRAHDWPGNVRELNSVVERVVLLSPGGVITPKVLALGGPGYPAPARGSEAGPPPSGDAERDRLAEALARTGWNISRTAALLGITRNTVRARMARYGLRAPGSPAEEPEPRVSPGPLTAKGVEPLTEPRPSDVLVTPAAGRPNRPSSGRPSIAVLPLTVEGGDDPGRGYFGEGVVEDIIGSLAALRELFVISRTSTFRYRGGVDVRVVGQELGVSYVLSGNIRRIDDRLRLAVELAESRQGTVVWGRHFDGMATDLFALQDEIASKVVATLAPQVREAELRRAMRQRPESMEAYDCLLRGLTQRYHLSPEEFAEAGHWLRRAIELDPGYAAPYAVLANWHSIRVAQGWSPDPDVDFLEVTRLSAAALERDSFDATALALCGHVKAFLFHEFDEAVELFKRALAASPNSALAWIRSSATYSYIGLADEAVARAEQGIQLSPLDPHLFFAHASLALAHYVGGRYEDAVRFGQKTMDANPRFTANLRTLAASLAAANMLVDAQAVSRALLALEPRFRVGPFVERYALRDPERRGLLAQHLILAGLPE